VPATTYRPRIVPRRILLLITDLEIGGTPTVVRELAIRLTQAGDYVEVASLKDAGPNGTLLAAAGIRITAFNASRAIGLPIVAKRLRRLVRTGRFDVVFSFLVHANAVAALAVPPDVPLLQSIQTTQPLPRWHWHVQRFAARRASRIVVPSQSTVDAGVERSAIPREKFVVIPNAVEPGSFERSIVPLEARKPYPIGFIGRLDSVKRIPDLIAAVTSMTEPVMLNIFGEGPERARIEQLVKHAGAGRVILRGAVSRPQLALAELGALVLPSEAEGFGLVLIEAMASGVPVIATDVPGIRDVVRHEHDGLLVPPRQPERLATAITRMVTDPGLRRRLIEAGLESVRERYTWDKIIPQYRSVLAP
jgi:glycosyltransferase involved in cell wall biosynthesis